MRANRFLSAMPAIVLLLASTTVCRGGDATSPAAIDVSLVTPDDFAAIVIHPRRIAESPLVAAQLKDATIAAAIKKFGIAPGEVEEMVVLLGIGEDPEPVGVVVVHFTHDVDAKQLLAKFQATMAPMKTDSVKEIVVGGKTCLDLARLGDSLAYAPSRNTIVLALGAGLSPKAMTESAKKTMEKVLAVSEPKGPLVERLKKADAESDFLIALAPEAFPNLDKIFEKAKKGVPPLVMDYLDAAKTVRGATATFNSAAPRMLHVTFDTKDAEAAGNVDDLLQQALRMASGGLAFAKQAIPKEMRATLGPVVKMAQEFVDGGKTTKTGSQVTLDFKRPVTLDTAGPQIVTALRQSVMEAREAGRRAQQMNNMKQVALAMINYESTYQAFPPAASQKEGKPLLSWRVAILPFLDEQSLYKQFRLDEPWDSPHNLAVAKKMPAVYRSADGLTDGKTRVMLFTGKGAAFDGGKKIGVMDIRDGCSNTILCVEAGADKAVPWTKPEDLPFDPDKSLAALGEVSPKGILVAFFDGSVYQLKVDNATLKALITPDGGEVIDRAKVLGGR